ncbi:hypothetical protein Sste5346_004740 [Sporothrix stenoceras]|uniref:Uncharacterized protein n=1 Tax=Sporothrix stenoceras TaxID=5173 RepID=A0ABR3Z8E9_9PEZI
MSETHVFREECHPGEICPRHRNVMTDNHRNYIKKIYKNLNKTHPDRNWKGIKTAARRPSPKKPTFVG